MWLKIEKIAIVFSEKICVISLTVGYNYDRLFLLICLSRRYIVVNEIESLLRISEALRLINASIPVKYHYIWCYDTFDRKWLQWLQVNRNRTQYWLRTGNRYFSLHWSGCHYQRLCLSIDISMSLAFVVLTFIRRVDTIIKILKRCSIDSSRETSADNSKTSRVSLIHWWDALLDPLKPYNPKHVFSITHKPSNAFRALQVLLIFKCILNNCFDSQSELKYLTVVHICIHFIGKSCLSHNLCVCIDSGVWETLHWQHFWQTLKLCWKPWEMTFRDRFYLQIFESHSTFRTEQSPQPEAHPLGLDIGCRQTSRAQESDEKYRQWCDGKCWKCLTLSSAESHYF